MGDPRVQENAVSDLSPDLRRLAVTIREAAQRQDLAVVKELSRQVLAREPGCVGVRELWYESELQAGVRPAGLRRRLQGWLTKVGNPGPAAGAVALRLAQADATLRQDFGRKDAWAKLIDAARTAGLAQTECLAWQTLARVDPADVDAALGWAKVLQRQAQLEASLAVAQRVLEQHPADARALTVVRQVSVAVTMKTGRLSPGGDPAGSV